MEIKEMHARLAEFIRKNRNEEEKCKMLSLGDDCKCPLCLLDNLLGFKFKQADVIKSVCDLDGKTVPVTFKVTKMQPSKLTDEDEQTVL